MDKIKLIFASQNENKYKELCQIIKEFGYDDKFDLLSLKELNVDIDVKETYDTLEENAIKKAKEVYKFLQNKLKDKSSLGDNFFTVSEDFGFFVNSLPEVAGVKSKRWLDGTDDERSSGVIELLNDKNNTDEIESENESKNNNSNEDKNEIDRKCFYKSSFGFYDGETERVFNGYIYGIVSNSLRGNNGFAYDKIFELENGKTIAELSSEEKNKISSRKEAFSYLLNTIVKELN